MNVLPAAPVADLDGYLARGGGRALRRGRELGVARVIEEVEASGLRGRGGAGFPTGRKWRSVREASGTHHYAVANGAEGEPGTFKDRWLLRHDPYQVVEGLAVAAWVVGAQEAFIGLKASFEPELARVRRAAADLAAAGLLGDLTLTIVPGPEEYLFGEETGLLEVVEGKEPLPRVVPPYLHGLFATAPQLGWQAAEAEPGHAHGHGANPTLVNNVETLAHATWIVTRGAAEFRSTGTRTSPGTMVFTVCGDVVRPGLHELPLGTPLRDLTDLAGLAPGRAAKMILSGVSNPVLTAAALDTPLDFDALRGAGGGLGSAGFVVYDDVTCAVAVARACSRFLWVESCGQCPPCKLQSGAITGVLERLEDGDARAGDLEVLQRALATVTDGNRCYLAVEEQQLVGSLVRRFPEDFDRHLSGPPGACPLRHDVVVPKLADFDGEVFVLDEQQERKRPDWTYAPAPA